MLPREKLQKNGVGVMTEEELVAAMIGTGTSKVSFMKLSEKIIQVLKTKTETLDDLEVGILTDINGVGIAKAVNILAGVELGRRLYGYYNTQHLVKTTQDAAREARDIIDKKQEYFLALFVNARYELIKKKIVGIGTVDRVNALPRDVLIPALECNCAGIILVHNHPSGDCAPSDEDLEVSKRMKRALDLVGFQFIDHVIVSDSDWRSIM
ncbi:DNA repair protein RadC [Candidatus Dojkabacteria bacterium]|nr:DNA repair protein RadC [Candidatus Dojkabacteria bacterium]